MFSKSDLGRLWGALADAWRGLGEINRGRRFSPLDSRNERFSEWGRTLEVMISSRRGAPYYHATLLVTDSVDTDRNRYPYFNAYLKLERIQPGHRNPTVLDTQYIDLAQFQHFNNEPSSKKDEYVRQWNRDDSFARGLVIKNIVKIYDAEPDKQQAEASFKL